MKKMTLGFALVISWIGYGVIYNQAQSIDARKQTLENVKEKVAASKPNQYVRIFDVVGNFLPGLKIPNQALRVFDQNLAMKDMRFIEPPKSNDIARGLGFTGITQFNGIEVHGIVYVVELKSGSSEVSIEIMLPTGYHLGMLISRFKKLDMLKLPRGKFILSSFNYTSPNGYEVKQGFNFAAELDLVGPLKLLSELKKSKLESIIISGETAVFGGVIPQDITKAELKATIPIRFGVNLTRIDSVPKNLKNIFREITTSDLVFALTPLPTLSFTIEGGIRLVLGTQAKPIETTLFGTITPTVLSMGAQMKSMLELGWLSLGDAAVQIDIDETILPIAIALGIPFTGIGLRGSLALGKSEDMRTTLTIAGKASVKSQGISDILLEVSGGNFQFSDLIIYLSKLATKAKVLKKPFANGKVPMMVLKTISGYISMSDTTIGGQKYKAGIQAVADVLFFQHLGKITFFINPEPKELSMEGSGFISNINISSKGKDLVQLHGPGPDKKYGTPDDGPFVRFKFDVQKPDESFFEADGKLIIPVLGISQEVMMKFLNDRFTINLETMIGNYFGTQFAIDLDPAKPDNFKAGFEFKGDFAKFLTQSIMPGLNALRYKVGQEMAHFDALMSQLSLQAQGVQQKGITATEKEIENTEQKIGSLKKEINELSKVCRQPQTSFSCPKALTFLAVKKIALSSEQTYLALLLKPGKKVITMPTNIMQQFEESRILQKTTEKTLDSINNVINLAAKGASIFNIKQVKGHVTGADLKAGKLPIIKSLIIEVTIPGHPQRTLTLKDIQFDFTNPLKSAEVIDKKLLEIINGLVQ